jgi:hypothetical protein
LENLTSIDELEEELNLLDQDNQKVILAKADGTPPAPVIPPPRGVNPSKFPSFGNKPSRPVSGVTLYRRTPKLIGQGLGGVPNPAGTGGDNQLDDSCPVPKKGQSEKSKTSRYDYDPKNKKKSKDQCELNKNTPREINEKFESNSVKKLVKTALQNQKVKQEYEAIKKRINSGVNPINIGKKSTNLSGNKGLIKGAHGRYVVEIFGDQVNVLGIDARGNNRNMQTFQNLMNEMYDLNLQY